MQKIHQKRSLAEARKWEDFQVDWVSIDKGPPASVTLKDLDGKVQPWSFDVSILYLLPDKSNTSFGEQRVPTHYYFTTDLQAALMETNELIRCVRKF